ncbi:SMI1/KNR4 family protein [Streptomyces sp. NPDC057694]|uniref:SMI1/KNR4 family protein n=1 Tax=Streptomyces sp. NPDC057694 TaxID=3346216 RepID=UPI0036B0E858
MLIVTSFDEVRASFWNDNAYGVQPTLTEAAVRDAELRLGVSLPTALLSLLRVQNGGGVAAHCNAFPTCVPTSWSEDHVPFDELMGIGRRERMTSILDSPELVEEWNLPSPVVLLSGDGHYWIMLDYRVCGRHGEPSITWFDTDAETELDLAPDFQSFVEGLVQAGGLGTGVQPV